MKTYLKLTFELFLPKGVFSWKRKGNILINDYDEEKENLKKYLEKHKSKNNCYRCGLKNKLKNNSVNKTILERFLNDSSNTLLHQIKKTKIKIIKLVEKNIRTLVP